MDSLYNSVYCVDREGYSRASVEPGDRGSNSRELIVWIAGDQKEAGNGTDIQFCENDFDGDTCTESLFPQPSLTGGMKKSSE